MLNKTILPRIGAFILLALSAILQIYIVSNGRLDWATFCLIVISISAIIISRQILTDQIWRRFIILITINLFIWLLYLWSATETTIITVNIDGTHRNFSAQSNDERPMPPVKMDTTALPIKFDKGSIGVYIGPQNTSRFFNYSYNASPFGKIAKFIDLSRLPPSIKRFSIRDTETGQLLYESNFSHRDLANWRFKSGNWRINEMGNLTSDTEGWAFIGNDEWQKITAEIHIVRANEFMGFAFLTQNDAPQKAPFLAIIPVQEVWQWGEWTDVFRPISSYMWFRKPILSHVQEALSLFIKNWQMCVAIGLITTLISIILSIPIQFFFKKDCKLSKKLYGATKAISFILMGAASITATWLALDIATNLLEKLPHVQDSVAYYFQAQTLALGWAYAPAPPFWEAFQFQYTAVNNNKWFTVYPPGWPILLAIGILAKVPWAVNPILLGLGVFFTSLAGYIGFGKKIAVTTAILLLSSSFLIILAGEYMSHTSGFFCYSIFLTCAFYLIKHDSEGRFNDFVIPALMGIAGGWLFVIRQFTTILIIFPFAIFFTLNFFTGKQRKRWLIALGAAILASTVYFIDNWAITGNAFKSAYSFTPDSAFGFLPNIGMRNGHTISDGLVNFKNLFLELLRSLFGWPLFVTLAFFFAPFVFGKPSKISWLLLFSAMALMLGYMVYWAPGVMYGPRYYYEAIPCFALLSAQGIWVSISRAKEFTYTLTKNANTAPVAALPTLAIVAILLHLNLTSYWPIKMDLKGYNFVSGDMLASVNRTGLNRTLVFVEDSNYPGGWPIYGNVFSQNDPLLTNNVIYAHDQGPQKNSLVASGYPNRSTYILTTKREIKPLEFKFTPQSGLESNQLIPAPTPIPTASPPKLATQTANNSSYTKTLQIEFVKNVEISGGFQNPGGIAIDRHGNILVLDLGNKRIVVLNKNGEYIKSINSGQRSFFNPIDLTLLSSGEIAVLDLQEDGAGIIALFSDQLDFIEKFSIPGGSYFPRGISANSDSGILIANTGHASVVMTNKKGELISRLGNKAGSELGQFADPSATLVTQNKQIYVVDAANTRVQILKSDGEVISSFQIPVVNAAKSSRLIELADGTLLMTIPEKGSLYHLSPNGKLLEELTTSSNGEPVMHGPTGLQLKDNILWISNSSKNLVQMWKFK